MADGIYCKYCGRQQTDHLIAAERADKGLGPDPEHEEVFEGRRYSLADCPGYSPENPKLAKELADEAERQRLRRLGIRGEIGD